MATVWPRNVSRVRAPPQQPPPGALEGCFLTHFPLADTFESHFSQKSPNHHSKSKHPVLSSSKYDAHIFSFYYREFIGHPPCRIIRTLKIVTVRVNPMKISALNSNICLFYERSNFSSFIESGLRKLLPAYM
jgi:hypothetical protein